MLINGRVPSSRDCICIQKPDPIIVLLTPFAYFSPFSIYPQWFNLATPYSRENIGIQKPDPDFLVEFC